MEVREHAARLRGALKHIEQISANYDEPFHVRVEMMRRVAAVALYNSANLEPDRNWKRFFCKRSRST